MEIDRATPARTHGHGQPQALRFAADAQRHPLESAHRGPIIEPCAGWRSECRRIRTRFDKLAVSCRAMFQRVMIERYPSILFSDRTWEHLLPGEHAKVRRSADATKA